MFAELKVIALLLALVWILPINSYVFFPRPCPANISTMQDLNIEQLSGHWNEHSGYWLHPRRRCSQHDIKLLSNGSLSISMSVMVAPDKWSTISAIGTVTSPGKLKLFADIGPGFEPADYRILGTDYENYAIFVSCTSEMTLWIFMRQQTPSEEAIRAAHAVLLNNALTLDDLNECNRIATNSD